MTAQKLEESATLSTTRYLEQVFEQTSDGIVYLDRSYNVTFVNRRAQELLAPAGEILGTSLWESFPEVAYPESAFVVHLQKSMEQHLPWPSLKTYYPEPLNLWFCVESRPTDSGVIVFLRNATQAHLDAEAAEQRQQKVERQRAEIATLYQVAPVALALIDAVEFRYLRVNDEHAAFFGLVPQELVGTLVTDKEPIEGVLDLLKRVAQGESIRHQLLEGEITPSPGQKRFWTVNYSPVFESDGRVVAISAASLEITRQKQAEAALIQSEKLAAVGRLATSISHEINNPLESITNLLYLIATDNQLPASMRSYVTMAQEELARVSQIATQTLRFHRQSVRATLVEARQLLGAVLDLYGARLMNAGVTVEARFDSETFFPCFENDLRQVLNNLIANAIDAMPSGGRLLVRSHDMRDAITGQSGVRLTIADSGLGMSSATRARAFEPFYTTKDMNGTGLGLWISADIVNRHGGKLRFRSSQNPAHHGTVFSVFQPLSVDLSASMEPNADIHLEEQDPCLLKASPSDVRTCRDR